MARRLGFLCTALSTPTVVVAVWFWRQDALDPLIASSLLLDRGLQILTLGLIPAVPLVAFAPARRSRPLAAFVGLTGIALGGTVAAAGVFRPPADPAAVAWATIALVCGIATLWNVGAKVPSLTPLSSKIGVALLGSAVALLQFWNAVAFLPSHTEASLSQHASVETVDRSGDHLATELSLTIENDSDVRVLVIITQLIACHWAVDETPEFTVSKLRNEKEFPNCTIARPLSERSWVSPKSEQRFEQVLWTPVDRPRLTVISRVAYARGDRVRITDEPMVLDGLGRCPVVTAYPLRSESRVEALAHHDRYLVYVQPEAQRGLSYHFDLGPDPRCSGSDEAKRLAEHLGTTENRTIVDRWLLDPDEPDAPAGGSTDPP